MSIKLNMPLFCFFVFWHLAIRSLSSYSTSCHSRSSLLIHSPDSSSTYLVLCLFVRRGLFREGKGPVLPRVVALTGYAEAPSFQSGSEGTDAHWELHEYTRIEKLCSVSRWNQRKNRAVQSFLIAVCGPIAFICLCASKVMGTGQKIFSAFLTPSP